MTRYECNECIKDDGELNTKPCVVIIPGDTMESKYRCLVTANTVMAHFKVVEETIDVPNKPV